MITLLVVLILSLVMPSVYGAGPMDEEPSTQVSPSTTSTPISPSTTGPVCEEEAQRPSLTEACRTTGGVYMGLDNNGNLVFSTTVIGTGEGFEPIAVYSVVQKSIELKRQNFDHGILRGYADGLKDALAGLPSNPTLSFKPGTFLAGFEDGFRQGYPDGYAAGLFEKNFKHLNE